MKKKFTAILAAVMMIALVFTGCAYEGVQEAAYRSMDEVPDYSGEAYAVLNGGIPEFTEEELTCEAFENYSELDSLGRCGAAYALICEEIMPTEKRGSIGQIKPAGWHTVRYDDLIADKYLYNRCHLIGYQLAGENANEKNLITGTRYMNVEGMLPFEDEVADYVHDTGNHVLYRVTPVYEGDELVARGVHMEAYSVEDSGAGVCFNVFVYNIQPGITIDYATGDSYRTGEENQGKSANLTYILNTSSHKFHLPECSGAAKISSENRKEFTGNRDELIEEGYSPCGSCNP